LSDDDELPWQVRLTMPPASPWRAAGRAAAPPVRKGAKNACWTGQIVLVLLIAAAKSFCSLV
jgi:hypothetical protein